METNMQQSENKPRGRQPGTKVQSLDYRAFKALRGVDFDPFIERAQANDDNWRDEMIDVIIAALREKDIF